MFNSDRFDTQNTEDQYAFLLFDFAVKLGKLKTDDPYFTEVKEELVKLVKERTNSAKFWRERHIELAKEVMRTAGLPDDFAQHGTKEAFEILRKQQS